MNKHNRSRRNQDRRTLLAYAEWAEPMAFCLVCRDVHAQFAHLRERAQGYMKSRPWHVLPLCQSCHSQQETARGFYADLGIPQPWAEAEHLWELYQQGDATGWAIRLDELHDIARGE